MRTRSHSLLMLGSVLVFMIAADAANAPTLTFKFTTVNVSGAIATLLGGINNAGVIVGEYEDKTKVVHCFKLVGSKVTTINSVSYTHLDVYKRQRVSWRFEKREPVGQCYIFDLRDVPRALQCLTAELVHWRKNGTQAGSVLRR